MKRSWQPPFWAMFGAGGMIAALIGWMLVFLTGIAVPLSIGVPKDFMSYEHTVAFARHPLGMLFLFFVVSLFLWHAAHRIYHTLHDFSIPTGTVAWLSCYGVAAAGTVAAGLALVRL